MKAMMIAAAVWAALIAPATAVASTLLYTIDGDGHHASFTLPSNPTNFVFVDPGSDFGLATSGAFDGAANVAGVTFYANPYPDATPDPGGLTYLDNTSFYQFNWSGPQLYSGPESAPVLLAFAQTTFTDIYTGGLVTISATNVDPVPEPATWAAMTLGLGLAGSALRLQRKRRVGLQYLQA